MTQTITQIRTELTCTFRQVLDAFATREDVLYYIPKNDGWSIHQVLEHIMLTNHFLLRMVHKRIDKALSLYQEGFINRVDEYSLDREKLNRLETVSSYAWVPQQYIEPNGDTPILQLKMNLHDQLQESLQILQNQKAAEAVIATTDKGATDAFHHLYFLVQHMQRHLLQIERVQHEFSQLQNRSLYKEHLAITDAICLN